MSLAPNSIAQLADLQSLRDPAGLNVRKIVQVQPRDSVRLQMLKRNACPFLPPDLSDPAERIHGRAAQSDFIPPRVVEVRVGRFGNVIRQRPRRAQRIVLVVAGNPNRRAFAILTDQVAVRWRLVGVDGLNFVLFVGFGEVVFKIPSVRVCYCRR